MLTIGGLSAFSFLLPQGEKGPLPGRKRPAAIDPERTLANSGFHGWADSARSIVLRLTPADLKSALRTFSVPVFGNVAMNST